MKAGGNVKANNVSSSGRQDRQGMQQLRVCMLNYSKIFHSIKAGQFIVASGTRYFVLNTDKRAIQMR
jgi:hypothetical protein